MGCKASGCNKTSNQYSIFVMIPSLERWLKKTDAVEYYPSISVTFRWWSMFSPYDNSGYQPRIFHWFNHCNPSSTTITWYCNNSVHPTYFSLGNNKLCQKKNSILIHLPIAFYPYIPAQWNSPWCSDGVYPTMRFQSSA